jgi:RND family efflux transporter MFP subunit
MCLSVRVLLAPALLATCAGCNSPVTPPPAAAVAFHAPVAVPAPALAVQPDPAHFTTTGPLVADQQSDVAAERDGRVVHIAVEIGDHVHRGQILASLDDRALRSAIDSQTAHLVSLRAQVREWESEEKMDGADLRRADQMRSDKILSEEGWEHVKYKLDEVTAEVARYRADATAAEADLAAANLQLAQCHIVAPLTGVVGRRSARLEQDVKKGDVLFWITAEAPLRILFTVPESAMSAFYVGAPLELSTADYPGLHQAARVLRVSPVVDPASDSIQVIGTLEHPSASLKPGMSMQVVAVSRGVGAP